MKNCVSSWLFIRIIFPASSRVKWSVENYSMDRAPLDPWIWNRHVLSKRRENNSQWRSVTRQKTGTLKVTVYGIWHSECWDTDGIFSGEVAASWCRTTWTALKMEAVMYPETSVLIYQCTRRHSVRQVTHHFLEAAVVAWLPRQQRCRHAQWWCPSLAFCRGATCWTGSLGGAAGSSRGSARSATRCWTERRPC